MRGLELRDLLSKLGLPLYVTSSGFRCTASDHPASCTISIFDNWVEDFSIPPMFLTLAVGLDDFPLFVVRADDAVCDIFYRSVNVRGCADIELGGFEVVLDAYVERKQIKFSQFCIVVGRRRERWRKIKNGEDCLVVRSKGIGKDLTPKDLLCQLKVGPNEVNDSSFAIARRWVKGGDSFW